MKSSVKNKGFCLITFYNKKDADYFCKQIKGLKLYGRELKTK